MKQFIVWSRKHGERPSINADGNITSDGVLGTMELGNYYLTEPAVHFPGDMRPKDLRVNECINGITYGSNTTDFCDIYRVR